MNHSTGVLNQKIMKNGTWVLALESHVVHPRVFQKLYFLIGIITLIPLELNVS